VEEEVRCSLLVRTEESKGRGDQGESIVPCESLARTTQELVTRHALDRRVVTDSAEEICERGALLARDVEDRGTRS
jgi:hypothetical protein